MSPECYHKDQTVVYFAVLLNNLPGLTAENHETPVKQLSFEQLPFNTFLNVIAILVCLIKLYRKTTDVYKIKHGLIAFIMK
jgi:hypothetical protein